LRLDNRQAPRVYELYSRPGTFFSHLDAKPSRDPRTDRALVQLVQLVGFRTLSRSRSRILAFTRASSNSPAKVGPGDSRSRNSDRRRAPANVPFLFPVFSLGSSTFPRADDEARDVPLSAGSIADNEARRKSYARTGPESSSILRLLRRYRAEMRSSEIVR